MFSFPLIAIAAFLHHGLIKIKHCLVIKLPKLLLTAIQPNSFVRQSMVKVSDVFQCMLQSNQNVFKVEALLLKTIWAQLLFPSYISSVVQVSGTHSSLTLTLSVS